MDIMLLSSHDIDKHVKIETIVDKEDMLTHIVLNGL